eukprot:g40649.t1
MSIVVYCQGGFSLGNFNISSRSCQVSFYHHCRGRGVYHLQNAPSSYLPSGDCGSSDGGGVWQRLGFQREPDSSSGEVVIGGRWRRSVAATVSNNAVIGAETLRARA